MTPGDSKLPSGAIWGQVCNVFLGSVKNWLLFRRTITSRIRKRGKRQKKKAKENNIHHFVLIKISSDFML